MKIVCDSCGSKYSIADDKVRGKVFKIRCKECDDVIVVQGDEDEGEAQQGGGYDDEGYGSADAAAEWYAVIDGEQVGPITPDEIEAYYSDGVLEGASYVWREGLEDWTQLDTVDAFSHLGQNVAGPDEETRISEGLDATDETEEMAEGEAETVVTDAGEFDGMFDDGAADDAATQEVSRSEHQDQLQGDQGGQEGGDLFSDFEDASQNDGAAEATREVSADEKQPVQQGGQQAQQGGAVGGSGQGGGSDFESFGGGQSGGQSGGQAAGGPAAGSAQTGGSASGGGMGGAGGGASRAQTGGGGAAAGGAGARRSGDKVGERSENSVLFSLDSVDEMEAVDDSESGEDVSGAGATTEGSGLIDIQNLAASHAAMKGDEEDQGGGAGGASAAAGGTGSSPGQNLSTQSMQSVPNLNPKGSRQNNTVLIAAIIAGSLVLLGAIGVVGYIVLTRDAQPTKVVKKTSGSGAAGAAQANNEAAAGGKQDKGDEAKAGGETADAGGAMAKTKTDAGEASADAGGDEEKTADKQEDDEEKVAANTRDRDEDRGSRPAPDPEPDDSQGAAGGGGGGSSSGGGDDDIDGLLDNVGNEGGGGGGGGGSTEEPERNLPTKPSRSDVLSTIRNFSGRVSSCASDQNSGDLSGTMKVKFQIEPSGRVSTTNIQTGKFQGTDVGGCVTGVVQNMKFPETKKGMPVVFPFSIE